MPKTVVFAKHAANIFFHILTQCNLKCRHCYINPQQHGRRRLSLARIQTWLKVLARRSPGANLIFLGGEPTLHPDLAAAVRAARDLGYGSITIDTNGYLFHNILAHVTPEEVDCFSFSLDGPTAQTNDALRGRGSFEACTAGITRAKAKGFQTSLIYTVSRLNFEALHAMPPLLAELKIDSFFIQAIGLRGQSAVSAGQDRTGLQLTCAQWQQDVLPVAAQVVKLGIPVIYPQVYLSWQAHFECAGLVADNYFIFPNGRVYRCPLCEDYPLHSLAFVDNQLRARPKINETDLFQLNIPEGCVMNRLIQPQNVLYNADGHPVHKIACCLLKEKIIP